MTQCRMMILKTPGVLCIRAVNAHQDTWRRITDAMRHGRIMHMKWQLQCAIGRGR